MAKSSETPIFEVKYIGTRGVDESFSYSQFDLGDAGQVYINNLTGNLVFTREELSTLGETEPYQISSTYNSISADSENQTDLSGDWLQGSSGIFVYFPHLFVDETGNLTIMSATGLSMKSPEILMNSSIATMPTVGLQWFNASSSPAAQRTVSLQ